MYPQINSIPIRQLPTGRPIPSSFSSDPRVMGTLRREDTYRYTRGYYSGGTANDYMNLGKIMPFDINTPFTIVLTIYLYTTVAGKRFIIGRVDPSTLFGWEVYITSARVGFELRNGNLAGQFISCEKSANIALGWHNLSFIYDGSGLNSGMYLYDGLTSQTVTRSGTISGTILQSSYPATICLNNATYNQSNVRFAEIAVFDRYMPPNWTKANYAGHYVMDRRRAVHAPALNHWWIFEDTSGSIMRDYAGNSHGAINGTWTQWV